MLQSSAASVRSRRARAGRAPASAGAVGNFDHENGTNFGVPQADGTPVRRDELVRNGEAEAGTTLARGALEGLEQMGARLLRDTWSIIADFDHHALAVARGRNLNTALDGLAQFDGLQGVAAQVAQHTEQLDR